jgi:hypothetical protein
MNDIRSHQVHDRFNRIVAILLMVMLLTGCGHPREAAPSSPAYHVTFSDAVTQRLTPARLVPGRGGHDASGGGGGWSFGSCGSGSGGGDLAAVIMVAVVVVVVVALVVGADGWGDNDAEPRWRYALHLTGDGLPVEVIRITDEEVVHLTRDQYDAIAHGAFSHITIQPAAWAKKEPPPVIPVHVAVDNHRLRIDLTAMP